MVKRIMFLCLVATLLLCSARSVMAENAGFKLSKPALAGDMIYDLREGSCGFGPSYTLGTFGKDQMLSVKGMWAIFPDENTPNKLGAGIAVSVPKALKAAGVQGIPDWFVLEIGVLGLLDIQDQPELSVGIYATLIRIPL